MRQACGVPVSVGSGLAGRSVMVHLDVCPQCAMPAHSHGLDPPPHHPCKVDFEEFVPQLYVPAPSLAEVEALLWAIERAQSKQLPVGDRLGSARAWLEQIRDELANDVIEA